MKLPKLTLGRFAIRSAQVLIDEPFDRDGVRLRVHLSTSHLDDPRDNDFAGTVNQETIASEHWCQMSADHKRHVLRQLVYRAVCHEVDEWLRMDGDLVTDPHPELKAKPSANVRLYSDDPEGAKQHGP